MTKISHYRLPKEELLLPYYLSDPLFTSMQDYLALHPLPDDLTGQKVELFTTLNSPIDQLDPLQVASLRIPVYGWETTADYFFTEGFFADFQQKLLKLIKSFPQVKIILEYQVNCFSLAGLKYFMEQFVQFRAECAHPGGIELDFSQHYTPIYLDVMLAEESWRNWVDECMDYMQGESTFDLKEISSFQKISDLIEDHIKKSLFGKNAKKQLLCTLYYSITSRDAKSKTTTTFPRSLLLMKKAAEAFLEVNPRMVKATSSQREEVLETYKERWQEKIRDFKNYPFPSLDDAQKESFLSSFQRVKNHILCEHTDLEMLEVATAILQFPHLTEGVVVEAGVFKGGGTVKLSLACAAAGRKLMAFDSFKGLPAHEEASPHILYPPGVYYGPKNEVISNLRSYGAIEVVELVEGWFEDTLPAFKQAIAVAYLDVDLVSSTTVCLRYLWPLMVQGGMIFGHDGHLPDVAQLINDPEFWRREFGESMPKITKVFGQPGFIKIEKI